MTDSSHVNQHYSSLSYVVASNSEKKYLMTRSVCVTIVLLGVFFLSLVVVLQMSLSFCGFRVYKSLPMWTQL